MRRHAWDKGLLKGSYYYQTCHHCVLHRREKVGTAGGQCFEYSTDGEMFERMAKVPRCASDLDPDVLRERAPRPPEELVEAMHDSIHRDTAKLRCFIPLKKRP